MSDPYRPFIDAYGASNGDKNDVLVALPSAEMEDELRPSFSDRLRVVRQAAATSNQGQSGPVVLTQFRNITDFSNSGFRNR